jgi:low temperature requirement protein LtrA
MEQLLINIVERHGFTAALVAFFVWWSWIREKRLSDRLDQVQDARTHEMAEVIRQNTEAMRALSERPCMAQHKD